MNLEEALAQDAQMKTKLLSAIAGQNQLNQGAIAKVDICMLGNWLHGEAEDKYPFVKSYGSCVEAHKTFHAELEKVARQINLGEYEQAKTMLASGTPCTQAFIALVGAVRQFKKDAKL